MALRDVKRYYYVMLAQYAGVKQDLADFEEAVRNGNITEDKLELIKQELDVIETNYQRLAFIMYLLEKPNRRQKVAKYTDQNADILSMLQEVGADEDSVITENSSALKSIRAELERLVK